MKYSCCQNPRPHGVDTGQEQQHCRRRRVLDLNPGRSRGMLLGITVSRRSLHANQPLDSCSTSMGQWLMSSGNLDTIKFDSISFPIATLDQLHSIISAYGYTHQYWPLITLEYSVVNAHIILAALVQQKTQYRHSSLGSSRGNTNIQWITAMDSFAPSTSPAYKVSIFLQS